MVKAKERRVVTVSRNGLTTRVLNVAVTDSLDAVCDKVEEQLSLTANSVILYLDKKMDKVLDDDACTWIVRSRASASDEPALSLCLGSDADDVQTAR